MRHLEPVDHVVARRAAASHGVLSREALLAAGLTRHGIAHRVAAGRLHRRHPGVYAVGHPGLTPLGRRLAAVVGCGAGAAVSHEDAAILWALLPDRDGPVHVTRGPGHRRGPAGVVLHRTRRLGPPDVGHVDGVPVTTPVRTLLDLAASGHPALPRALNEAQVTKLVSLDALLTYAGGKPGARAIRALATETPGYTRSRAERLLLALARRAELPRPQTNAPLGPYEVDALWPRHRLALEVDGWAAHSTRQAFERDRVRDAELQIAGYRILRVTWDRINRRPEAVAAQIAAALATGPG